jgi:hypothetical protein
MCARRVGLKDREPTEQYYAQRGVREDGADARNARSRTVAATLCS